MNCVLFEVTHCALRPVGFVMPSLATDPARHHGTHGSRSWAGTTTAPNAGCASSAALSIGYTVELMCGIEDEHNGHTVGTWEHSQRSPHVPVSA